jgi:hypothetical protein
MADLNKYQRSLIGSKPVNKIWTAVQQGKPLALIAALVNRLRFSMSLPNITAFVDFFKAALAAGKRLQKALGKISPGNILFPTRKDRFSMKLVRFNIEAKLKGGAAKTFYDIQVDVPADASPETILVYMQNRVLQIKSKEYEVENATFNVISLEGI